MEYERADYFFTENAIPYKDSIVEKTEFLIQEADKLLNITYRNKKIDIYFNTSLDLITENTYSDRIILSVDNEEAHGRLISYISNYKFPAWLSIGIEHYLMADFSSEPQDNSSLTGWLLKANELGLQFGDACFIPGFNNKELNTHSAEIAFLFVSYLKNEGFLQEVVDLFLEEDSIVNEQLIKYWRAFTESENNLLDVTTKYLFNFKDIHFEITTDKAKYQFKSGEWDYQNVMDYVYYIEDGIEFVGKWFNYEIDQQIIINLFPNASPSRSYLNGFAYNGNIIEIYRVNELGPFAAVHEIVHVFTNNIGKSSSFFPFNEGLAEVISYEFDATKKGYLYDVFKEDMNNYLIKKDEVEYYSKVLKSYQRISGETYEPSAEIDLYAAVFSNSIWEFEQNHYVFPSFTTTDSNYTEDLNGYAKAGSFVLYLLEQQGKDGFIKVYENIEDFKDVYGKDLREMVEEWKNYIGVE